jgi:hypothetical protein
MVCISSPSFDVCFIGDGAQSATGLVTLQAQVEVHLTSSTLTTNYYEIVSKLPPAMNISSRNANWEDYEDLPDPLGEANSPPTSNNEVELQVLTQISTDEN